VVLLKRKDKRITRLVVTKVTLCAYYKLTSVACQYIKGHLSYFLHFTQRKGWFFVFYDQFVELCQKKGISRTKACIECGVSRTAWHKWQDGAIPNGTTLNKFADYFGVSVGFLLDAEQQEKPTPKDEDGPDPLTERLNELLAQATDETKLAMIALLEQFLKRPETQVSLRR